ncbi:MAG: hypothetical protein LBS69_00975 [Prevotellaceae bacterium]|nr:hypothetical protein [Prevotellaceae bacterium]
MFILFYSCINGERFRKEIVGTWSYTLTEEDYKMNLKYKELYTHSET